MELKPRKTTYRTIWISDVHLGTPGCNADMLLDFLKRTESETLYLVGDIIDGWRLKRSWYWHPRHNDIIRRVLKKAKQGTRVIYIPGNHDEVLRPYVGLNLGGVELRRDAIHETADGKRLLVLHGDEFDGVVLYARWLAFLGDKAYGWLLNLNIAFNYVRRKFNMPYWSLSAYLKHRVKNVVEYVGRYSEAVVHAARDRKVDGVVCGHIHTAEITQIGDVVYYNDGDWVESCTALVENFDGSMELLDWIAVTRARASAERMVENVRAPLADKPGFARSMLARARKMDIA